MSLRLPPTEGLLDLNWPKELEGLDGYTQEQSQRVCQLLSQYAPYKLIAIYMQRVFHKPFPFNHYAYFRQAKRWQPLIKSLRQQYLAGLEDVPISQQRVRLERLEELYQEAQTVKLKREVLEAARDEMKEPERGDRTRISITAYYEMSAEELENKRQEILNKLRHLKALEKKGGGDAVSEAREVVWTAGSAPASTEAEPSST